MRLCLSRSLQSHQHIQHQYRLWSGYCWRQFAVSSSRAKLHAAVPNAALLLLRSIAKRNCRVLHWFIAPHRLQAAGAACRVAQMGVGRAVARHRGGLLLGAVCLAHKYNFDDNGITDVVLERYRDENQVGSIKALMDGTMMCPVCDKRQATKDKVPGVDYCECRDATRDDATHEGWQLFIEKKNTVVWRRPHHRLPHLYSYKVYGRYDDVSLCAFVETQLSTTYRTDWDQSVLDLHVVDTDTALDNGGRGEDTATGGAGVTRQYSAQDLLYWLVKFPRFFANRDYVYHRRYRVDTARREVVIVNEAAGEHCGLPDVSGVHRVHDYWSVMVIRATQANLTKPGIEYVLCYFDNPGSNLPSSILNFIASTAFPNFLEKLHTASLQLQCKYEAGLPVYTSLPRALLNASLEASQLARSTAPLPEETQGSGVCQEEHGTDVAELELKNADVDTSTVLYLMQALGEMTPVPQEKLKLLHNVEMLLNETLSKLHESNPLVAKILSFKDKIDQFRLKGKLKKEQSLTIMNEVNHSRHRYEDKQVPLMVQQLFENMREVMKADHDMRTGRSLQTEGNCPSLKDSTRTLDTDDSTTMQDDMASDTVSEDVPSSLVLIADTVNKKTIEIVSVSKRDTGDHSIYSQTTESPIQTSWSGWFYYILIEKPIGLFTSSKVSPNTDQEDRSNTSQNHESKDSSKNKDESIGKDANFSTMEQCSCHVPQEGSNLWYYLYGWFMWPIVRVVSASPNQLCSHVNQHTNTININNYTDQLPDYYNPMPHENSSNGTEAPSNAKESGEHCSTEATVDRWYWRPVTVTVRCGQWVYSYVTNSKL